MPESGAVMTLLEEAIASAGLTGEEIRDAVLTRLPGILVGQAQFERSYVAKAATAKALNWVAGQDVDSCPCKRCAMIRSVVESDEPNTYGLSIQKPEEA